MPKITFEEKYEEIKGELAKRRSRWQLKAIPSIDYDDIQSIIMVHIWKQWSKYDQSRPFLPWVNTVITNQITNQIRNLYGNFARPCVAGNNGGACPANQGDDRCAIYGKQCPDCPLYARWEKFKKSAHDTKLPLPLEMHSQEVFNIPENGFDMIKQSEELHKKMKLFLNPMYYKIYKSLYIDGKSEEETAKLLGYKTSEKHRIAGYRQFPAIKKYIIDRAKKIIEEEL